MTLAQELAIALDTMMDIVHLLMEKHDEQWLADHLTDEEHDHILRHFAHCTQLLVDTRAYYDRN